MFWEEKIERIKTKFTQNEFRVPFSDRSEIMKKMEARFVISSKPAYRNTNWSEGLKERVVLRKITYEAIFPAISTLDPAANYWVVIVLGDSSMVQQLIYDCKPAAIVQLVAIAPGNFFIGDKKYQWLVYFNKNRTENTVTMIKAGSSSTPLDAFDPGITMNKVEMQFADKALRRGGMLLFRKMDALNFVQACKKQGVDILGIDSFIITDTTTQPSLEHSVDFSDGRFKPLVSISDEATSFLLKQDDHFYFEIVCQA